MCRGSRSLLPQHSFMIFKDFPTTILFSRCKNVIFSSHMHSLSRSFTYDLFIPCSFLKSPCLEHATFGLASLTLKLQGQKSITKILRISKLWWSLWEGYCKVLYVHDHILRMSLLHLALSPFCTKDGGSWYGHCSLVLVHINPISIGVLMWRRLTITIHWPD